MLYRLGSLLSSFFFRVFYRVEIIGAEHIPMQGPLVICCNHINNLDPPLLGSSLPRKVHFMAKKELFQVPILKQLLPKLGAFPISRGAGDKGAIKIALKLLKEDKVLGIFPEGTRSKTGALGKAHSGAAFIALRSEALLVPAAITGPYRLFKEIRITFGNPIDLSLYREGRLDAQTMEEVSERTMGEIEALLPRGRSF